MNDPTLHAPAPSPTTAAPALDVALRDWDILFAAVRERLHQAIADVDDTLPRSASAVSTARFEVIAAECVDALDQLQATLEHQLGRCRLLAMEITDVRTTQARARADARTRERQSAGHAFFDHCSQR